MNESAASGSPATTTTALKFPGWYKDPKQAHRERFWNGAAWTSHVRSIELNQDPLEPGDELPASLLGPIDPSLLALLDSFEGDHGRMGHPQQSDRNPLDH